MLVWHNFAHNTDAKKEKPWNYDETEVTHKKLLLTIWLTFNGATYDITEGAFCSSSLGRLGFSHCVPILVNRLRWSTIYYIFHPQFTFMILHIYLTFIHSSSMGILPPIKRGHKMTSSQLAGQKCTGSERVVGFESPLELHVFRQSCFYFCSLRLCVKSRS